MKLKDIVTTLLELVGLVLIVAGIAIALGLAPALIVAGILLVALSYVLTTRGGRP